MSKTYLEPKKWQKNLEVIVHSLMQHTQRKCERWETNNEMKRYAGEHSTYLNNYFNFHVCLFVRSYVCPYHKMLLVKFFGMC